MPDQAQNLRELVWRNNNHAHVIAITSGKGGVGKTNTCVNLAIALAKKGKKVIILDVDLGLANVEVLLGLSSMHNIENVIEGSKTIQEILVQAPCGVGIVPGSSGLANVADLSEAARQRLLDALDTLQLEADFILLDTMAGISRNAVAFNTAADEVMLITTPEPSAMVDAYAMLKTIHKSREDAVIRLVVNMAANQAQAMAVANKLAGVSQQYLGRNLALLGFIPRDPHVNQAVMRSEAFLLSTPGAPASKCIEALATKLLRRQSAAADPRAKGFFSRFAQTFGLASNG